jgi:phage shock protein E
MMRYPAIGAVLLSVLLTSAYAGETPRIDQATLLERIERHDPSMIVVDVRTPEEFAAGHVPGAINIPYTDLPAGLEKVTQGGDPQIVLYCETGRRAGIAADTLGKAGFRRLLHLDGDMKQWREQQRPTEQQPNAAAPPRGVASEPERHHE